MFIDQIGSSYANENLVGSHFVYDGKVYRLEHCSGSQVEAYEVDGSLGGTVFPATAVTGWRTFKYPRLGYRRIRDDIVGTVSRAARSYTRGLSYDNIIFEPSDETHARLFDGDEDELYEFKDNNFSDIIKQALLPTYDQPSRWNEMLNGEARNFVPSHNVLCEKTRAGAVKVYISSFFVGSINGGVIKASPKNVRIIENMVRKYAS